MSRILLIDSDLFHASIYAESLRREGLEVQIVGNGEDALRMAAEHPMFILLDLALPRIDGFTVLQRLKADAATSRIPVFVFSHFGHRTDIDRCMTMGAEGYIIKTHCRPDELIEYLRPAFRFSS